MAALRIVITTLIAIGALVGSLVKSRKIRRLVAWSIIVLVALGGVVEIIVDHRRSKEEAEQHRLQGEMTEAITQLRNNSDQEKTAKEFNTLHNQQVRAKLQDLMDRGIVIRNGCQGVSPSIAEKVWVADVEKYLNQLGSNSTKEFLNSSELLPGQICFSRMNAYVYLLEKMRDGIPSD